mmetsp:Transcript_7811/g.7268  ORF Transcript_7811/g.7268 Transcript_7811/m.7268 type:complete len:216 (+) Transcript_7811:886-1533(+)
MAVGVAHMVLRVARVHGFRELEHAGERLPGVVSFEPLEVVLGVLGAAVDGLHDGLGVVGAFLEGELVLADLVGQMDLQPEEAFFAEGLSLGELEDAAVDVRPHVVEVRGDGVDPPSEVQVVREVDRVDAFEALSDAQPQLELTPQPVVLLVQLVLLQQLQLVFEGGRADDLRGDLFGVVTTRDLPHTPADRPHVLDHLQDLLVQTPPHHPQSVQH